MTNTKVEFTLERNGQDFEQEMREILKGCGKMEIDTKEGRLLMETNIPWSDILTKIESTGRRAVLSGFGGQAAVSILDKGSESVTGVVRLTSSDDKNLVLDGVVDGLEKEGQYNIQIYEYGHIEELGDRFGEKIGPIYSDINGRTTFRLCDKQFAVPDLIGRSICVEGVQNERLACGIIARAAGIDQNFKRICTCDGIAVWDERFVPAAGKARQEFVNSKS